MNHNITVFMMIDPAYLKKRDNKDKSLWDELMKSPAYSKIGDAGLYWLDETKTPRFDYPELALISTGGDIFHGELSITITDFEGGKTILCPSNDSGHLIIAQETDLEKHGWINSVEDKKDLFTRFQVHYPTTPLGTIFRTIKID